MIILKIKAVCELTGLTSRAVRVYIEEQLISPDFTENYLGRRTFDFCENDVAALKDIAILRKNGFSIEEIREMMTDAQKSIAIVQTVKNKMVRQVKEYNLRVQALSTIEGDRAYTISELAEALSQAPNELPTPQEQGKPSALTIVKTAAVLVAVWLPIVLCLVSSFMTINEYVYPKFNALPIALTVLTLSPSIIVLVISKIKFHYKNIVRKVMLALCIISIPLSFVMPWGIVTRSETTDFRNYRDFDARCLANRNVVFQELFPQWPHYFENVKNEDGEWEAVYLDAKYYYQFLLGFDYTYDVYAQWPLDEETFHIEVLRAKQVFEKAVENQTYNYRYAQMERGSFTCLILYSGDEPFQKATNNYDYIIFAYNEKTKVVRYIYCDSLENGADQPYYLKLDW